MFTDAARFLNFKREEYYALTTASLRAECQRVINRHPELTFQASMGAEGFYKGRTPVHPEDGDLPNIALEFLELYQEYGYEGPVQIAPFIVEKGA